MTILSENNARESDLEVPMTFSAAFQALKNDRSKKFNARAIELIKYAVPNHDFDPASLEAFRMIRMHDGMPGATNRATVLTSVQAAIRGAK